MHDLTLLSRVLAGEAPPQPIATAVVPASPDAPGEWIALGILGAAALAFWLGGTYLLACFFGMPAGMLGFFIPPVALAVWSMAVSAGNAAREPEIERAIRNEAAQLLSRFPDLAAAAAKQKT